MPMVWEKAGVMRSRRFCCVCGREFFSNRANKKTCSDACANKRRNDMQKVYNQSKKEKKRDVYLKLCLEFIGAQAKEPEFTEVGKRLIEQLEKDGKYDVATWVRVQLGFGCDWVEQ